MDQQIDLRKLAEASGPDRCFLSVFIKAAPISGCSSGGQDLFCTWAPRN